jgi:hypothetical protein
MCAMQGMEGPLQGAIPWTVCREHVVPDYAHWEYR